MDQLRVNSFPPNRGNGTLRANDFIVTGIATPSHMNVIPSKQLIKKSDIPEQYHRILQESAGHCRSQKESACVRKLLEAARLSRVEGEKNSFGIVDTLSQSQDEIMNRLYADSPRGLSHLATGHSTTPTKFVEMIRNKVVEATELNLSEQLDESMHYSSVQKDNDNDKIASVMIEDEEKSSALSGTVMTEDGEKLHKEKLVSQPLATNTEDSAEKKTIQPVRPVHPLFSPNALALGRATLKKVKWTDVQDKSGPKIKSSLALSSEFPEQALVQKLQLELDCWLMQQTRVFKVDVSSIEATNLHETLGVGKFAKVVVADLSQESAGTCRVALKIATFTNAPDDITCKVSEVPRGVLLSWKREMSALISLSKIQKSDLLVNVLGGCLNPRPMIALELCDGGNLTQYVQHKHNHPNDSLLDRKTSATCRLQFARDCCLGLAAMHKAGWCHLDVKAHNVMISKTSDRSTGLRAKLGDFGSAFHYQSLQCIDDRVELREDAWLLLRSGVGTSGWTAPELLYAVDTANDELPLPVHDVSTLPQSLRALHWSADCFSFGILLWYCLYEDVSNNVKVEPNSTHLNPLIGLNSVECRSALEAHIRPPWPSEEANDTAKVRDILESCFDLEVTRRPHMSDVDAKLKRILNSDGIWQAAFTNK